MRLAVLVVSAIAQTVSVNCAQGHFGPELGNPPAQAFATLCRSWRHAKPASKRTQRHTVSIDRNKVIRSRGGWTLHQGDNSGSLEQVLGDRPRTVQPTSAAEQQTGPTLRTQCLAEFVGTAFIVFVGCSAVASAVTTGAQVGLWQVAAVWGWTVAIAIYCVSHISGAHFNPAMSFATKLLQPTSMSWRKFGLYTLSQTLGAAAGAAGVLGMWGGAIQHWEALKGIKRGGPGSELSAAILTEFFPNPGVWGSAVDSAFALSPIRVCMLEAVGVAVLAFVSFSLGHNKNNTLGKDKALLPLVMGFTVATIVSFLAPLTMAGLNPARDLGPRIVAFLAGWGQVALPGPRGGWWAYTLGPLIGAPIGGSIALLINRRPVTAQQPQLHVD